MIGVGVIGYGYWGPNLVRNFVEAAGSRVVMVSDLRPERLAQVQSRYPSIRVTTHYEELLAHPEIDAVVIATPVSSHAAIATLALEQNKHVLVEKPMTASVDEAVQLVALAEARNRVLMVDHTFAYTAAVRKIRELIDTKALGDIYYYDAVRVNLGLFQHDVNVIWDLAVHDLAVMDYLFPSAPCALSATGISHIPGQPENVAYITLFFEEQQIAHVHVNWLAPVKVRRTLIGGSEKMVVYDDLEPSEKVKVYDKGVTLSERPEAVYQLLVSYRSGDMWAPRLDSREALQVEVEHFNDCVKNGKRPETDGHAGLRMARMLEAADRSLRARGEPVRLQTSEAAV